MVEDKLCQIEEDEAHQEEEEETADVEMVDEEERSNSESSGPHMEADTEDIPPLASGGDTVSSELCLTSPGCPGTEEGETS